MSQELPKGLLENLEPGEKVLYAVKKRIGLERPKWLVVTDRRVIVFDEKILGRYELKAIPFEKLEKVSYHGGVIGAEFVIEVEGGEKIVLTWMDKEEARKAINAVYEAVKSIAIEPPTVEKKKGVVGEDITIVKPREVVIRARQFMAGGRGDVADLLRYLKELRDRGVLSEEEYQEKVKKLLEKT
ncbi:MAG: PH domain-containing protein [Ignisphaera sp.]|nr:PH domain-containing protein [Ignisphaera sp.]